MAGIIKKTIFRIYQTTGRIFLTPMLMVEWKKPLFFKEMNERPMEFGFAFKWLSKTCPKEVLDIGSGTTSWPHVMANCGFHVTAMDKIKEYWEGDFFNRHYYVIDDDITDSKLKDKFDLITCISVLEHIP
ncbi:MAG: methyltransferase domain-containing protein, partial [Thermoplasmata archaeon]|nr:methyltransferase domain-containing protein [Thermoplasmata archaeon]